MPAVRDFRDEDAPAMWALNNLPNVGATADPTLPLALPPVEAPTFADLRDVRRSFHDAGGGFVVAEVDSHLVGMGGFRPSSRGQAEMLRIRVHPAMRRRGVGRAVMAALEARATARGLAEAHLDTATNQPEAVAFYRALGYREVGRETRPEWSWTLVYFTKSLAVSR